MAPGREDLLIEIGSGFGQSFTYEDSTGTPIDLSAYAATAIWRPFPDSPVELLEAKSGSEISLSNLGVITLTLTAGQTGGIVFPDSMSFGPFPGKGTSRIPPGAFSGMLAVWDLKLFPPSNLGQPFVLLTGVTCFVTGASSSLLTPSDV